MAGVAFLAALKADRDLGGHFRTWKHVRDCVLHSHNTSVFNGYTQSRGPMSQSESQQPIVITAPMDAEQISYTMRQVARRQWSLWSCAVMVTVLLAVGIASFAFPGLLSQAEASASFLLTTAIRGIVGLVLIFNVYTVYQ